MFSKLLQKKESSHQFHWKKGVRIRTEFKYSFSGIFPRTFREPVNSKNLILNTQSLHVFFSFFFVFKAFLKDSPFCSSILMTLWLKYLKTHIKVTCIYLFSQLFFKTKHFTVICRPKFNKFSF